MYTTEVMLGDNITPSNAYDAIDQLVKPLPDEIMVLDVIYTHQNARIQIGVRDKQVADTVHDRAIDIWGGPIA